MLRLRLRCVRYLAAKLPRRDRAELALTLLNPSLRDLIETITTKAAKAALFSDELAHHLDERFFQGRIRVMRVDDYRVDVLFTSDEGATR